ncbi:amidohydrolase family protein [Ramlibacter sp. WS9]|uniref:amidohydrolase family protein n=1 Tax=Ramlibacter sp. WS9 TaxID=1882741 RepID=UPI0013051FD4|nr:amidohydrolase family protein [Ramlibacter sp. WS9]
MMKIDIHAHIVDRSYIARLELHGSMTRIAEDGKTFLKRDGDTSVWWREDMFDVDARLSEMDRLGIDIRILSLSTPNVYEWTGAEQVHVARDMNDRLADMCAAHPDRFLGLASLPLDDVDAALEELDRAIGKLNLKGVALGSNIAGEHLDADRFEPFWERLNALKVPVFMHPMFPPPSKAMSGFELPLRLGLPFDTTLAATRLIYSGVLERYPDVVLILAHTGGTLIPLLKRLDNGFRIFPECRKYITQLPSVIAKQLYYDTASFSPELLAMAINSVGVSQILFATDDPYIGANTEHVEALDISDADKAAIFGGNAKRLLRLDA